MLLLCLPAIGKDSGYFGCDFVDNKVSATYYFAPAKMAGIKTGDQIVAINKQPVTAQNSQTTLTMLKGEPGTKVKVTVLRKGQKLTFTVTRESLPQPVFCQPPKCSRVLHRRHETTGLRLYTNSQAGTGRSREFGAQNGGIEY
ncbi:MAG: PDZ domain-containing protein [Candidatus Obscuribacter sp.]|nr:PDZ domain-containing protein [Candidatus Obscuribacter sp.]